MRVEPIETYNPIFAITLKPPKKMIYAPNCWNEVSIGKYKDYTFKLYNNFVDGKKGSTLIVLSKGAMWIKSKLKYMFDNERKILWSYAKGTK